MNKQELMPLTSFLRTCDGGMPIVIENLSGVGGAGWLAHPQDDWKVHECLSDLPHGAYTVVNVRVKSWDGELPPILTLMVIETAWLEEDAA